MADSIGSTVDFNMLRSWIKTCEKNHGDCCAPSPKKRSTLRLIECKSRRVIPTPKPPEILTYAALSYVWGSRESNEVFSGELPKQLPKTIEDAIAVTKSLGIPYLWIDRYCIKQTDEWEKSYQCSLMHKIYENAHITIIAAAGSGPDHGLPGIGSSTRAYPSVRIGSHLLVPTLPDPRRSIQGAKWSTRGWTYQEGRLSQRRLIFTDRQVLFVCKRAYTNEAEQKLESDAEFYGRINLLGAPFSPISTFGESGRMIWDEISQFSKLDLSHQEDCLNAMLGILQRYQESDWVLYDTNVRIRHLAGLPVMSKVKRLCFERSKNQEYSDWTPAILEGLGWTTKKATKRRVVPHSGFPSWSWTAWKAAEYLYLDGRRRSWRKSTFHWNKSIFVERPNGGLIKGPQLHSLLEAGYDFSRIRFIHLKAPALNFKIFSTEPHHLALRPRFVRVVRDKACVIRHHGTDYFCPFDLTDLNVHIPEDGLRCWGIMIFENFVEDRFEPLFLLVTKVKDWYERIGVAEVAEPEVLEELETRSFRLG